MEHQRTGPDRASGAEPGDHPHLAGVPAAASTVAQLPHGELSTCARFEPVWQRGWRVNMKSPSLAPNRPRLSVWANESMVTGDLPAFPPGPSSDRGASP